MPVHKFKCHVINQDFHILPSGDLHQGSRLLYSDRLGGGYCFMFLCCLWACWQGSGRRPRPRDLPSFLLQLSLGSTREVWTHESYQPYSMSLVCLGLSSSPEHLNRIIHFSRCDLILSISFCTTPGTFRSSSVCIKELSLTPEQATMAGNKTLSRTKHVDIELQLRLSGLESVFIVISVILHERNYITSH